MMAKKEQVPVIRFQGFADPWEQRKFNDVFSILQNCTLSRAELSYDNGEAFNIHYGDVLIKFGEVIDAETALLPRITDDKIVASFRSSALQDGDIVIADTAEDEAVGKCAEMLNLQEKTAISGLHTIPVRPTARFATGYLGYFMNSPAFHDQLLPLMQGTKVTSVSKSALQDTVISFPSERAEQGQIGRYFMALDTLITLHQRKYDKLVAIKRSMLEKMFPREGSCFPEIRFAGFTDPWEQRKLGDVVKEITRNDPESEAPIMMITANNGFIEQSERYAFNNAGESLKKYILLKKGELAYNHGASKLRPYGSCFALTTAENARIPFVYHCFSAEDQNAEFMSIELNGAEIENQLRKIVSSGARMDGLLNISFDEYTSVSVLLPGTEEQDRIADFFRHLDNLITLHQRKLEKLQAIKRSMLEKMFV